MINPFRKTPPDVSLNEAAFARWLRARSPQPLSFFLGLDEAVQETLAGLGDDYAEDGFIALAYAIRDPEAAAFGATSEGEEDDDLGLEENLVQRMAAQIAAAAAQNAQIAPESTRPENGLTMGGLSKRRTAFELEARRAHSEGRRLLGREADEVTA